jgi:hypothetical protein
LSARQPVVRPGFYRLQIPFAFPEITGHRSKERFACQIPKIDKETTGSRTHDFQDQAFGS